MVDGVAVGVDLTEVVPTAGGAATGVVAAGAVPLG